LIVSSQDTQALDLMEELAAGLPADHKDYLVFRLKYAMATSVATTLEGFFKEKSDDRSRDLYSIIYAPCCRSLPPDPSMDFSPGTIGQ
jgi:hypothetical protein